MQPLIFVIYDGIDNSVFPGQILTPLLQHARNNPQQPIHLISFERRMPKLELFKNTPITVHLFHRWPFLGRLSLLDSAHKLKNLLKDFSEYELIARGPLAGFLCLKALSPASCTSLTIQARGLLAEEYAYVHASTKNPLFKLFHFWRKRAFTAIESATYGKTTYPVPTIIEVVSEALKHFLLSTYYTPKHLITIATQDVPKSISDQQRVFWRNEVRRSFSIHPDAPVFCYNGSLKAWQCPEMTISFFKHELTKNPASILLVLTLDQQPFITLLQKAQISPKNYRIKTVAHKDVYRYLAACDVGIIFRKHSIINWVSRPTKVLEYRAVGLHIVHNNTISMLTKQH